jgi:hypothetical protein
VRQRAQRERGRLFALRRDGDELLEPVGEQDRQRTLADARELELRRVAVHADLELEVAPGRATRRSTLASSDDVCARKRSVAAGPEPGATVTLRRNRTVARGSRTSAGSSQRTG